MTQKPKAKTKTKVKPIKPVAPQFDLNQFQIRQRADDFGIHINIMYAGHHIHAFVLSVTEYTTWQWMSQEQKFAFIQSRTNPSVFYNDRKIVNLVIRATINLLDVIFARAQAQRRAVL